MASPFTVVSTSANSVSLGFSAQNRVSTLCDGSLLVAVNSTAVIETLYQITNPSASTPTVTALAQTFTYPSSTTSLVADLLVVNNGTTTSDVWLALCSDATAGATIRVAHGTYTASGSSWSWDNTGTTAVTATLANSQTCSMAWNGTDLILVYREGSWTVNCVWTATKNGSAGWSAAFILSTTTSAGSHCNPILRHDALLANGAAGATICLYPIDTVSTHADKWAARVLLDSAASAASANWKAETINTAVITQNFGTALTSACVDPATGRVHLAFNSSTAGTGGAVGTSYEPITVNASGIPTFGTRVLIDTTSGASVAICIDVVGTVYVFYSSAAVGSNSIIDYKTIASPYTSASGVLTTVFSTTANGNNMPHVPGHDQAISGYVPLLVQVGKTTPWISEFDNTIAAGIATVVTPAQVDLLLATFAPTVTVGSGGTTITPAQVALSLSTFAPTLTISSNVTVTPGVLALVLTTFAPDVRPHWLQNGTQTQSGISGGPPGNGGTETDVWYEDASGNGVKWGFNPAYGGSGGVPWYDRQAFTDSIPQTNLGTSKADSNFHIYSNVGGVFLASEDPTYTLSELSNAATRPLRAYYDSGTSAQDANGFTWRVRSAIFAGEPFIVCLRVDMVNAGSVTTAATDSYEFTALSGLTQTLQGGVIAWQLADGGSGIVGGAQTTPLPAVGVPQANEPDYLWIKPHAGSGVARGVVAVKKQTVSAYVGGTNVSLNSQSNANRLKIYYQTDRASATTAATRTWYEVLVYRAGLTNAEAGTIGADATTPDVGTVVGTGTPASPFFDNDEFAYVASASSNQVSLTHTISGNVTKRWICHYKLTNYTATNAPLVSLAGTPLTAGVDYLSLVDTANQVAYVKLLKGLVVSGAGATELNNGALVFAAAFGTVITPAVGTLVLATFAPTVSTPSTVTPAVAALTLATFAPSVVLGTILAPAAATLTLTGFAPVVVTPVTVTAGVLALSLSTFAPSILVGVFVAPANLALALTGFAPTVTATANISIAPAALGLVLLGYAPTINGAANVAAGIQVPYKRVRIPRPPPLPRPAPAPRLPQPTVIEIEYPIDPVVLANRMMFIHLFLEGTIDTEELTALLLTLPT